MCTHHPGFAAEVVDGEERVNAGNGAVVQADHEVPEVLARGHAVGVLANQHKIWLERSGERKTGTESLKPAEMRITGARLLIEVIITELNKLIWRCRSRFFLVGLTDLSLLDSTNDQNVVLPKSLSFSPMQRHFQNDTTRAETGRADDHSTERRRMCSTWSAAAAPSYLSLR